MLIPKIDILNYTYELPDLFIASHPLPVRDASRLLFYNQGRVSHHSFYQIPDLLPTDSLLIANESRVIPARITLHKPSGAK
ncbi:MAG: S-adenosylmethionine:tRNA ribosyltransferase-isomerase, partial [Flavobacteriales bacterium]|nr:S-adenosylmethionine:tRNA ribosyltransferase-isomerase [Flavobacteriales bacterium]